MYFYVALLLGPNQQSQNIHISSCALPSPIEEDPIVFVYEAFGFYWFTLLMFLAFNEAFSF